MKKLNLGFVVLALSAASPAFAASTGTISFTGSLVTGTCTATVNGGSSASGTTDLPIVNIASLATANATYADTPFKITLTGAGCASSSKFATPYFESEPAKVNSAGRLINTVTSGDEAENIDIQIVTSDKRVINLNAPASTQETPTAVVAGSGATATRTYNYFARYFATAAAVEGDVESSVSYSIFYK